MKLFKKIILCLFVTAMYSFAYAEIIELDALNVDHCRQQILRSKDFVPIIGTYTSDSKVHNFNSEEFIARFELLAKKHPERTFFKWDSKKDELHITQTLCLQQLGYLVQPNMLLLAVFKDEDTGKAAMTAPFRLEWAGQMTINEMSKFIGVSDSFYKKALLSQKKSAPRSVSAI